MECDLWQLLYLKTLMIGPTSPIPSHGTVMILFKKCPSASIVVTNTLRVKESTVLILRAQVHIVW